MLYGNESEEIKPDCYDYYLGWAKRCSHPELSTLLVLLGLLYMELH